MNNTGQGNTLSNTGILSFWRGDNINLELLTSNWLERDIEPQILRISFKGEAIRRDHPESRLGSESPII